MTIRLAKISLLFAVALFYTLVVSNNITDYSSNYLYINHVLDMDTTYPGNHGMWRAVHSPFVYKFFYVSIIGWEFLTGVLAWAGGVALARKVRSPAAIFDRAKRLPVVALTLSLLMWFLAFLTVGGEWFLMWQSKIWNGQEEAFRMFAVVGIVLIFMVMPDTEAQA
jgi:predicted small integral membrane protein